MAKICIPAENNNGLGSTIGAHFGRVPYYCIYDTDTDEMKIIDNTSEHMGGLGMPPELLSKEDINVMCVSGIGRRAIDMFEQFGIDVFVGLPSGITIEKAIDLYVNDKLTRASNKDGCGHDHDHKKHHDH